MKSENWVAYFQFITRNLSNSNYVELDSKIYFPALMESKPKNYAYIIEIKNSKINTELKLDNNPFINFELFFTQDNHKQGLLSDLDEAIKNIIEVIRDLINKKSKNNNHYKESLEFLKLTYKPTLNSIIDEHFNISDTSYSLSLAVDILNSATNFINENDKICFTGSFEKKNETWKIKEVKGITEKLIAVLITNINKFVIPFGNKKEVLDFLKISDSRNNIIYFNKLTLIFVDTLEEVLESIYKKDFFETSNVRNVFDIGFLYKQKTLESNLVKIKSVFNFFNDKNIYDNNIKNYVKIKYLGKSSHNFPVDPDELLSNFEKRNKNIILIGESGSGKSSILKKLLLLICNEGKDDNNILNSLLNFDKLPIFLDFKSIDYKKYKDDVKKDIFIKDIISFHLEKIAIEVKTYLPFLEYLYENNKLIFILDAYDEKEINTNLLPEKFCIISSKYQDKLSGDFYKTLQMNDEDKSKFIINYLKIEPEKTISFYNLSIFSNPLFLSLFLLILNEDKSYSEKKYDIKTESQLIDIFIKKFLSRNFTKESDLQILDEFGKIETKIELASILLKEIAFFIFYSKKAFLEKKEFENIIFNKINHKINEKQGFEIVDYKNLNDVLSYLSNSIGIIEEVKNEDKIQYVFFHNIFYEFFLAKYFVENLIYEEQKKWITLNFFNIKNINIFRIITYLVKQKRN